MDLNDDLPLFTLPVGTTEPSKPVESPVSPDPVPPTGKPSIEELWDQVMGNLDGKKPKRAKKTDDFRETLRAVKKDLQKKAPKPMQNGAGYEYVRVWNEDGSDYKSVPRARVVLEQKLGRPLADHERAFFIDKSKKGEAKYHPDNIIQGYKDGVPLDLLTCGHCGCRGNWTVSERETK